jgi:hypothetical protein
VPRDSDYFLGGGDGEENEEVEESPTTLPSNKHKYVMPVNNSKIARKPYYR